MSGALDRFLLIWRTTREIMLHPIAFGNSLDDTIEETLKAARYLVESIVFVVLIFLLMKKGFGMNLPLLENPFTMILLGAQLLIGLITGLVTHFIAQSFSQSDTSWWGSLASFLYWIGYSIVVFFIVMIIWALLFSWLLLEPGRANLLSKFTVSGLFTMLIGFYFLFLIGTWIRSQYKLTLGSAIGAVLLSYVAASFLISPLIFVY